MRLVERLVWLAVSGILLSLLYTAHSRYAALELAFIAKSDEQAYVSAATELFIKQEGGTSEMINSFYVSYLGFKNKSCVNFIPKRRVTGGPTGYCFTKNLPIRPIEFNPGEE